MAIVKTIIFVKIKTIQQTREKDYKYLSKFYTLLGNVIIGLLEFRRVNRTTLRQL